MTRVAPPEPVVAPKHPRSKLAGSYGHPTHPIAVTIPIGAWVASLVFDIVSHLTDHGEAFARGALWLIGIGVVGALFAAVTGFLDLLTIPTRTKAFRTGLTHMALNTAALLSFMADFGWRAGTHGTDHPTRMGPLLLSVITLLVLAFSGYLGGKLAYTYGVRVADEGTQAQGLHPHGSGPR